MRIVKNRLNGFTGRIAALLAVNGGTRKEFLFSLAFLLIRIGLGCLFVYAGFIKLLDPKAFAHSLARFDLLPEAALPLVAVGLPALELLAGLGLMVEFRGSLTVIAILLALFLSVLGYAIFLDLDVDCGCFTVDEINARTSVKLAFSRDLGLLAAVLFLYRRRKPPAGPRGYGAPPPAA